MSKPKVVYSFKMDNEHHSEERSDSQPDVIHMMRPGAPMPVAPSVADIQKHAAEMEAKLRQRSAPVSEYHHSMGSRDHSGCRSGRHQVLHHHKYHDQEATPEEEPMQLYSSEVSEEECHS